MSCPSSVVDWEAQVERRLSSVVDTQESVQSLSLWAIHHKTQHQRIVDVWMRVLLAAGVNLRLSLFHLCNEILQTCKRRNADSFKESFRRVLNDAVLAVRGSQIQSNVARILQIWTERNVYEGDFIEELLKVLYEQKQTKDDGKPSADFKPKALMDEVRSFDGFWNELQKSKRFCNSSLRDDTDSLESLQLKMRDDRGCEDECREALVEMTKRLREDVDALESVAKKRKKLLEQLHLAEAYYDGQYADASVVVQAYKNYGNRINNLKLKLNEQRNLLPDPRPQSEDSKSESAFQRICAVMNKSLTSSAASSSANNNRDKTGLESFLSNEGGFMTFLPRSIPSLDCQYSLDIQGDHPVRTFASGDGDSTPVQDEPPDDPPEGDPPLPYHDPMEFLSQLINKSAGRPSLLLPSIAANDSSPLNDAEFSRSDVLSRSSEDLVVLPRTESLQSRGIDFDRSALTGGGQGDSSLLHVRDRTSCDYAVCRDEQTHVASLSSTGHVAIARHHGHNSSLPECFRADKPYNCASGNDFSSQTNCIKKNIPDHRSVQTATDRNNQNSDSYSHYMT